jgi:iron complex outermembrane receptor protein
MRSQSRWLGVACLGLASSPALAQRTGENALRSAEDAFGTSIGSESIGLYSSSDVRGFSPFAAGNIRLEGLYLDAVTGFNLRLVSGSSIRVGISALGYPFPAPTGIADFRLRLPGDETQASFVIDTNSLGLIRGEVDSELPLIPNKLSLGAGIAVSRDPGIWAQAATHASAATTLRWKPKETVEVIPFWSIVLHRDDPAQPRYIMAGPFLPTKVDRFARLGQKWTLNDASDVNYGTIARYIDGRTALSVGIFRSLYQSEQSFSDLFLDVSAGGEAASHRITKTPSQKFASTSGEIRASQAFAAGSIRNIVHVAARGRNQTRRYGGSTAVELGPDLIGDPALVPEPEFQFGPQSRDEIRQFSLGLGYEGRWQGKGELTLGMQKTRYRKESRTPTTSESLLKASPWLYNAAAAVYLSSKLAAYAGFTRGLEESAVAPDTAVNRDEAPPAILTRQYDAGIRWTPATGTRFVAGVFNVEKPYFSLDPARFYRRLGEVRHRGAEISLTSAVTPNLNLLAGAVLLDARVTGEASSAGLVGERPVGSTGRTLLFNAEYRPPSLEGLSFDVGINSYGRRTANTANTLDVPALTLINVGARYRRTIGKVPTTLRLQVSNLFDEYAWEVRASNAFFYSTPRTISLRLTADL